MGQSSQPISFRNTSSDHAKFIEYYSNNPTLLND